MANVTESTLNRGIEDPVDGVPHVGMDVHKDTLVVAVATEFPHGGRLTVADRGTTPNRMSTLERLVESLTREYGTPLHFVYEAGPCGFVIWRRLRQMGHTCAVGGRECQNFRVYRSTPPGGRG